MKKLIAPALALVSFVGVFSCTQLQGRTALEAIADNTICVSENFDSPWEAVVVKCALRGENLDYLKRLWASSRATARRAGAAGMAPQ